MPNTTERVMSIGDAVMYYDNAIRDRLRMTSWPVGNIDAQALYYCEFLRGARAGLGDYFALPWDEREAVRDYLDDNNFHSAVKALSILL